MPKSDALLVRSVMGVDPGSRYTGYAFFEQEGGQWKIKFCGRISLKGDGSFASRLAQLYGELSEVLDRYQPEHVSIEKVFLGKSVDSAFKLGHARGVCILAAANRDLPVFEYAARQVKKVVTGSGAADKEHVALILNRLFRLPESTSLDASDAAALAWAHILAFEQKKKMDQLQAGEQL